MEQENIAREWLKSMSKTVIDHDLDAHMALISKKVRVYGIPGRTIIYFRDWRVRRRNEFEKGLLTQLVYTGLKMKTSTALRVIFEIEENMHAKNCDVFYIDKDIILEKEEDGRWRVVEETINYWSKVN